MRPVHSNGQPSQSKERQWETPLGKMIQLFMAPHSMLKTQLQTRLSCIVSQMTTKTEYIK